MNTARIAIFASGAGSNAKKIIDYFSMNKSIQVVAICTNRHDSGVTNLADLYKIPLISFSRTEFYGGEVVLAKLDNLSVTHVVLAGFLWLVPVNLLKRFPQKIINIHPALLPKFGGKGMYGMHVHEAVKNEGQMETGITIHLVNEHYDEGKFLRQERVLLSGHESPQEIASKVQALEHKYYPIAIEEWINVGT